MVSPAVQGTGMPPFMGLVASSMRQVVMLVMAPSLDVPPVRPPFIW